MLILTRRPVESICIGDDVTVTVLGVVGNQVRFGIEAPRNIVIDREEIYERKRRAALARGGSASTDRRSGPGSAGLGDDAESADGSIAPLELRR